MSRGAATRSSIGSWAYPSSASFSYAAPTSPWRKASARTSSSRARRPSCRALVTATFVTASARPEAAVAQAAEGEEDHGAQAVDRRELVDRAERFEHELLHHDALAV